MSIPRKALSTPAPAATTPPGPRLPKPARRSNAAVLAETKAEHRKLLAPLRAALRPVFDKMSYDQASRIVGTPAWRIRRILSANAASPNYVDMTNLIVAAGITPNQGAQLAGLYRTPPGAAVEGAVVLDEASDPRLVYAVKHLTGEEEGLPPDSRESLLSHLVYMIDGEKQLYETRKRHPRSR